MNGKQELINYLEQERSQRQTKIIEYGKACEDLEEAKKIYNDAKSKVDSFGNVEILNAEIEKISGFINDLTTTATPLE